MPAQILENPPANGRGFLSRENRTAIELFLADIQEWEAGLRRQTGLQIQ
jgi:hypothetical protein